MYYTISLGTFYIHGGDVPAELQLRGTKAGPRNIHREKPAGREREKYREKSRGCFVEQTYSYLYLL